MKKDYYPFGMVMPGRKYSAGTQYRFGFNGKENDNEVKGEGNQQDYGMRIYDPRLGKFLSVDPLTVDYPELSPFQFASNRPIAAIDLDGLEAKDLYREIEPIRAQRKEEQKRGIIYPESRGERNLRYFVTGGLGIFLLPLAPITAEITAAASLSAQITITNVVIWASNPVNQIVALNIGGFTLSILNPDPNNTGVDLPGEGDQLGSTLKLMLKAKSGREVQLIVEKGASFANQSEINWLGRLLNEGNNVRMMKESTVEGVKSVDLFVNNIKTELKEISNVVSTKLGDQIKKTMEGAIKQAGNNGNIIIDVTKQSGATKDLMQKTIERLIGKAKQTTNYRIVGEGFELKGTITPKN